MLYPKQLFYISAETWRTLDTVEVKATVKDMKKLGIYHLPYPKVTLRIAADGSTRMVPNVRPTLGPDGRFHMFGRDSWRERYMGDYDPVTNSFKVNFGEGVWLEIEDLSLDEPVQGRKRLVIRNHPDLMDGNINLDTSMSNPEDSLEDIAAGLIVLLNTRNARKHTVEHKCAKLGIGKGDKKFQYVTTISLPTEDEILEDHESVQTGIRKSPHLRRGHIRRQRHGPALAFTKEIWIEPMFINADEEWVSKRERYNVSL